MRAGGYETAIIGKWHLKHEPQLLISIPCCQVKGLTLIPYFEPVVETIGRTIRFEWPDMTVYIRLMRSQISRWSVEEPKCGQALFLDASLQGAS